MNPFYCEICRFYGKTSQSLKYHLSKNSCGEHNRRKIIDGKKFRICKHKGCEEVAKYSRDRVPKRCSKHKRSSDCLSKAKRCNVEGCNKQPFYGCQYKRKKERCGDHKLNEDVNLNYKISE